MGFMGIAVKVLIGLVLLLPMTAYVVGSLVAAAVEPLPHEPIIVQEQKQPADNPGKSPSQKHTQKSDDHHGKNRGHGGGSDDNGPKVVPPSPSVMDDDGDVFDDHGGGDSSGKGSGDGSSGKGSGHG